MKSSTLAGVAFFGGIALIVVAGLLLPFGLVGRWVAVLVLMIATFVAVGFGVVGSRPLGSRHPTTTLVVDGHQYDVPRGKSVDQVDQDEPYAASFGA